MEFRAPDEFEEVDSPYAARPVASARKTQRLRNKKNVFNRPFAAEPSAPPAVYEARSTRKSIGHGDNTELLKFRDSELGETPIDYLEPRSERRPARVKPIAKKKLNSKMTLLPKLAWGAISLMVLRLVFMDRGVYDYYSTQSKIQDKNRDLQNYSRENEELKAEISRIHVDANYQRQLAKEHLGVIAADEFLILFAQDNGEKEIDPTML